VIIKFTKSYTKEYIYNKTLGEGNEILIDKTKKKLSKVHSKPKKHKKSKKGN
jgi:hypothetical protein